MNIFFLDKDPAVCAKMHVDKHVVKMVIEYAQLLSTAHRIIDGDMYIGKTTLGRNIKRWRHPDPVLENILYKASHIGHPSQKWCMENEDNYQWLASLWVELCKEYTYRYGKVHMTQHKLDGILQNSPKNLKSGVWRQPPPAMSHYPECIVEGDSIASYHNYYVAAKKSFAIWSKRGTPVWFSEMLNSGEMRGHNANIQFQR